MEGIVVVVLVGVELLGAERSNNTKVGSGRGNKGAKPSDVRQKQELDNDKMLQHFHAPGAVHAQDVGSVRAARRTRREERVVWVRTMRNRSIIMIVQKRAQWTHLLGLLLPQLTLGSTQFTADEPGYYSSRTRTWGKAGCSSGALASLSWRRDQPLQKQSQKAKSCIFEPGF